MAERRSGPPPVLVVTAAQSVAVERRTIAAGTPARALMQRAGAAAAAELARRFAPLLGGGVAVHAGPGNNGGDAYVVAAALARTGVRVALHEWFDGDPRTDDARFERDCAVAAGSFGPSTGSERLVVDGILGTGASGAPRGRSRDGVLAIRAARASGATVVALDVPTGLDATSGAVIGDVVQADCTLTFGSCKRGLLIGRGLAGELAVLDIGLDLAGEPRFGADGGLPMLVMRPATRPLAVDAHKGTRGRIAIVGGGAGMVGATLLAGRAALASGAGLVRLCVAPAGVPIAQLGLPAALAAEWPSDRAGARRLVGDWAHAVLLGPGLGTGPEARALCELVLRECRGPVVVDADALNVFAGEVDVLGALLRDRPALITPHPLELTRLMGTTLDDVLARRFELPREVARQLGATVLLKGVPTVVADASETRVVATGAPALATGGSGDVLGGIAATLLAQAPHESVVALAAEAAWVHDRAGALAAAAAGGARGVTLDDVLGALGAAWPRLASPPSLSPVLAALPAVLG